MNFKTFSFHPKIMAGIDTAGYSSPTPIQAQAIPKVMQGRDVLGLAQTGTGKTAAYVLPILHRLLRGRRGVVRALVIAPTRELAEQIHQTFKDLGTHTHLRSVPVYGGTGIQAQIRALKGADIVVACPGRLLDHISRNTVGFSNLEVLVLDEADQMFDMGFLPDIRKILTHLPQADRQTLLFSATMPRQIRGLADEILDAQVTVRIAHDAPAKTVNHALYPVAQHLKTAFVLKLLKTTRTDAVLVFTRTKHRARRLAAKLGKSGYCSTSLQGNLSQAQRRNAMNGFKSGKYQVMVATDIASRGLDISNVSHVINFDMPSTPEIYIHRIGRTGRADRSGQAFTLMTKEDAQMVRAISRSIGRPVEQRILEDFDYQAISAITGGQRGGGNSKQAPVTGNRRKKHRRSANAGSGRLRPQKPKSGRRPGRDSV